MRRLSWCWLLGVLACGDDARPASSLDGGLDATTPVATRLDATVPLLEPDGGLAHAADGGLIYVPAYPSAGDATTTGDPANDAASCSPQEQMPVPLDQLTYTHREGTLVYPDPPPVGGDHNPCWGNWGIYDPSMPLAVEHWVHNLEHGGIVFLYHCPGGCDAEVAQLADFVKGHALTLLTPYDDLPTRFGVVAWGYRLTSDCFELAAYEHFYSEHVNMGREQIADDPPAACL